MSEETMQITMRECLDEIAKTSDEVGRMHIANVALEQLLTIMQLTSERCVANAIMDAVKAIKTECPTVNEVPTHDA
jgi:maleate cis-trans isomerase